MTGRRERVGLLSRRCMLRRGPAWTQQRAQEEVIALVLHAIAVEIFPPSSSQVSGIAWTEFGRTVYEELEFSFHRQWISGGERVVVQTLAGDEYRTARCRTPSSSGAHW